MRAVPRQLRDPGMEQSWCMYWGLLRDEIASSATRDTCPVPSAALGAPPGWFLGDEVVCSPCFAAGKDHRRVLSG